MRSIIRLTLKNIFDKKIRFVLTSLSVVLGVMFTVGVFIFTDSLRAVFGDLSEDIAGEIDLSVRSQQSFGDRLSAKPVDPVLGPVIEQVEGVRAVAPGIVEFNVAIVDTDGSLVESGGNNNAPKIGVNWDDSGRDNPEFETLFLVEGRQPSGGGEFAVNTETFADNDLELNQTYSILLPEGPRSFELVGYFNFADPDEDKSVGATLSAFDTPTAEEVLNLNQGWDEISVVLDLDFFTDSDLEAALAYDVNCPWFECLRFYVQDAVFDETSGVTPESVGLPQGRPVAEITAEERSQIATEFVRASIDLAISTAGAAGEFDNIEVISNEVIVEEQEDEFEQIIGIFQTFLLAFAGVILLVSVFVIFNTFTIILGQRIREIGLMRALGATSRQIFASIVGEALVVGLFSSGVGILAGLGLAYFLRFISNVVNFDLPLESLSLVSRTVVVAFIVGTGVTLVSAVLPALRSRRVSPMAALRDDLTIGVGPVKQRTIVGSVLVGLGLFFTVVAFLSAWQTMAALALIATICLALGGKRLRQEINLGRWLVLVQGAAFLVASVVAGFSAGEQATALGLGALILIVGANLISPVFVPNLMRGIGIPIRWLSRTTGKLSTENAARAPSRTATTAAALMIGLALVSTVSLVATSLKATFQDVLDDTVESDWFLCIGTCGDPDQTFSQRVAEDLRALPELESVLSFKFTQDGFLYKGEVGPGGEVSGSDPGDSINSVKQLLAINFSDVERHINVGLVDGGFVGAAENGVAIHDETAEENDLELGDVLAVEFDSGELAQFEVVALYDDSRVMGNWIVDIATWERYQQQNQDAFVSVVNASGVSEDQALAAIESITDDYPQVNVQTRKEFNDSQTGQIDQVVIIVNVFLFLALVVAFIGIANTLALSVIERTRELGLLRAVGMKRGQMLLMVIWEGVLIAVFGGLMGIGLGIVFGVTAVTVIPDQFISVLAIPWQTLVVYLVGAGIAGLISALLPARRASRLDVLDAIATE